MNEWHPEQVQAIIFDLDGTLYNFPHKHFSMALRLWKSISFLRHLSGSRAHLRKELFENGVHLKNALYYQLARRSGHSVSAAREWYDNQFWPSFIQELHKLGSRPGLADCLNQLHKAGIKLVVLSDYDHIAQRLDALGLDSGIFDQLLSSEEFGQLKPAAAPFLAALDSVKVTPAHGLVIGDSPQLDEAGALAANIPFLGIGDKDSSYASWNEIEQKLRQIVAAVTVGNEQT